ncbi:MAG: RNA polymerase sigma factor [Phycisphaerales bacterium]|nr:RNA polymerase sigma factor [Phycisphaerales bacterium]
MNDVPKIDGCAVRTDEQVIVDVLGGNTSAFELLMRRHNQRLYRLARAVVGDDNEAEEVVQEAFVRAYGALSKFEGRSTFGTWMTRIAYHEALRSRSKRKRTSLRDANTLDQSTSALQSPVESVLYKTEARKMITQAYDKLSATHRTVIMLRLIEGMSTRETAECMRVSESNVKVLLHRAKAKLVDAIEERSIPELREQFSFAGERCDRIVAGVLERLMN